jgi:hypothetical protein
MAAVAIKPTLLVVSRRVEDGERLDPSSKCDRCGAYLCLYPNPAGDGRPVNETVCFCVGCLREVARSARWYYRRTRTRQADGSWLVAYRGPGNTAMDAYVFEDSPTWRIYGRLPDICRAFRIA